MATPHVSGAVALLIQQYEAEKKRVVTEPEIYKALIQHTVSLAYSRAEQGNGLLQLQTEVTHTLKTNTMSY
jgi:major intracellular serine protease